MKSRERSGVREAASNLWKVAVVDQLGLASMKAVPWGPVADHGVQLWDGAARVEHPAVRAAEAVQVEQDDADCDVVGFGEFQDAAGFSGPAAYTMARRTLR